MIKDGMYGPPCIAPRGSIVLHIVWTYYVKWDVIFKFRSCCDGSVLKGRRIAFAHDYTSFILQPGMRIFWAIVAICGWVAVGADTINAFSQAPLPRNPCACAWTIKWPNGWRKPLANDLIGSWFSQSYARSKVTHQHAALGRKKFNNS
jgi:hypothetical protein